MTKILKDTDVNLIKEKNIVLVGGCFDILHKGHVEFLNKSKQLGDTLVVLLENDSNVKKLKGKGRPINNQDTRSSNLTQLESIDYVVLLRTPDSFNYYYNLVNLLKPDIIAITKGDPLIEIKRDQARVVGARVVEVMERNTQHSSTQLAQKILKK